MKKQNSKTINLINDDQIYDAIRSWPKDREATITLKSIQGIDTIDLADPCLTDIDFKLHAFEAKLVGLWGPLNSDERGLRLISTRDDNTQKLLCIVGSTPDSMLDFDDGGFDDVPVELFSWQIASIEYEEEPKAKIDTKTSTGKKPMPFTSKQGNKLAFIDGVLHANEYEVRNGKAVYRGILRAFGFWFDDGEDLDYPLIDAVTHDIEDNDDCDDEDHVVTVGTSVEDEYSYLGECVLAIGCFVFTASEIPKLFEFLDEGFGFENTDNVNWKKHIPGHCA